MTNIDNDSTLLIPHNHQHAKLSPGPISESRRQLMEMINNMPESCYELSVKDTADDQHGKLSPG